MTAFPRRPPTRAASVPKGRGIVHSAGSMARARHDARRRRTRAILVAHRNAGSLRAMTAPSSKRQSLLDRLANGVVVCAEGYVFELERRGYLQAGAFVPEVV